jgi:hypothetical protein
MVMSQNNSIGKKERSRSRERNGAEESGRGTSDNIAKAEEMRRPREMNGEPVCCVLLKTNQICL